MNQIIENGNNRPHVPLTLLRRFASRAMEIVDRHAGKHGAIAAYKASLVPIAEAFNQLYDVTQLGDTERRREVAEAVEAAETLRRQVVAWGARLQRDIPGIDLSTFHGSSSPADDIIEAANGVLEKARAHGNLAYLDALLGDIETALASASKEREEAQSLLATRQENAAELRRLAHELQAELVALRRTLRAVLGASHRDVHKLRQTARGKANEDGSSAAADGDFDGLYDEDDDDDELGDDDDESADDSDADTTSASPEASPETSTTRDDAKESAN